MLTRKEDVDIHALKRQGMTISEIARRTGRDRKTIRAYLNGDRTVGVRKRASPDPFDAFEDYVRARLAEDPHLWAQTLMDELAGLGFALSYQSLTRKIRERNLRPVCPACRSAVQRPNAVIEHPPGEETQFDWLELPDPPAGWGMKKALLLVGSLAHSGRWRAALAPSMDQPHLLEAMITVITLLGGTTRVWRFDRMATVCNPATGDLNPVFAGFAKHYGVSVAICPPRAGNRKGVVEKANQTAAQRWWRTLPDDTTFEAAQASVAVFAAARDARDRRGPEGNTTVAAMAAAENLAPLPAPYPVVLTEPRTATRQALASWRGNLYSVPPELAGGQVTVTHRLGTRHLEITAADGTVIARHLRAENGLGAVIRDGGHVVALNAAALAAANTSRPHRRKERIPPGPEARAAAGVLRGQTDPRPDASTISLAAYERAAAERTRLP
jgi:transposase